MDLVFQSCSKGVAEDKSFYKSFYSKIVIGSNLTNLLAITIGVEKGLRKEVSLEPTITGTIRLGFKVPVHYFGFKKGVTLYVLLAIGC